MSEAKQSLRLMARDFRKKIDVHPDLAELAAQNFIEKFSSDEKKSVAVYMTAGSEIDIYPLVEQLWARGVCVLLPCVGDDRALTFRAWNKDSVLIKNKMDIFEPDKSSENITPDIMIVPLLAFDQQGYRLGQGGGYYDTTIASLRTQNVSCLYVGYAYAEQAVLLALPREDHDQRLDFVVTPQKIFDFRD